MIAGAVDAILVLVVIEGVTMTIYHRRTGRGVPPSTLWPNLAAGFLLTLAVRMALGGSSFMPSMEAAIAGVLACALVAHLLDLRSRWR